MKKKSDNNNKHSRIRYALIFSILLAVYICVLLVIALPKIKENIEATNIKDHASLYKSIWSEDKKWSSSICYLYGINGPVATERWMLDQGYDKAHAVIEGLLLPLSEEEIKKGLVTYIPEKTELVGVTENNGYIFIDLTNDILFSSNIDKAINQIEMTIKASMNVEEIYIISDKTILNIKKPSEESQN